MNKALIVVAGLVATGAAAYVGGSSYMGRQVEQALHAQNERLMAQMPFAKITEKDYHRGLFSSTRTVTVKFGCDQPAGAAAAPEAIPSFEVTVHDTIRHGPIAGAAWGAASIHSELELPAKAQQAAQTLFGAAKPMTIDTVIGFDRSYTSRFDSPKATLKDEEKQIVWQGLQGTVAGDAAGKTAHAQISAPGLELTEAKRGMHLKFENLQMQNDSQVVGDLTLLPNAKSHGQVAKFEVGGTPAAGAAPFTFVLNDVKFDGAQSVEKDLASMQTRITGSGSLGDTKLDKLEMAFSMKRLHAPTYQQMMSRMMQHSFSCGAPKADPQAEMAALQQDLVKLLPYNPEYALDKLSVDAGGKHGELSSAIGIQGATADDAKLPVMQLLQTKGTLRADAKLPTAWIAALMDKSPMRAVGGSPDPRMLDLMLDRFVAQGYVVRDGDNVSSSLRYAGGALLVNGKPLGGGTPGSAAP